MHLLLFIATVYSISFDEWIGKYFYEKIDEEYDLRKSVFEQTTLRINELENEGFSSISNDSPFSIFTEEEISAIINYNTIPIPSLKPQYNSLSSVKGTTGTSLFNWADFGKVTKIRGGGSNLPNAVIDLLESSVLIQHPNYDSNNTLRFSVQELIDCQEEFIGKTQTQLTQYFLYLQRFGFVKEVDYPLAATKGKCVFNSSHVVGKIQKRRFVSILNDDELIAILHKTPIVVFIDMPATLPYYNGKDVFVDVSGCKSTTPRIAFLLIGYGVSSSGVPYWTLKHNWGESWGDNGYLYLRREGDVCGLYSHGTYIEKIMVF